MSTYGSLNGVRQMGDFWFGDCPSCGLRARLDAEQYRGEVSVDCPECDYHETWDHREETT